MTGLTYFNNFDDNSFFFFQLMCEQLPSGTDVTTNWCFWWELEKKTVFFI